LRRSLLRDERACALIVAPTLAAGCGATCFGYYGAAMDQTPYGFVSSTEK